MTYSEWFQPCNASNDIRYKLLTKNKKTNTVLTKDPCFSKSILYDNQSKIRTERCGALVAFNVPLKIHWIIIDCLKPMESSISVCQLTKQVKQSSYQTIIPSRAFCQSYWAEIGHTCIFLHMFPNNTMLINESCLICKHYNANVTKIPLPFFKFMHKVAKYECEMLKYIKGIGHRKPQYDFIDNELQKIPSLSDKWSISFLHQTIYWSWLNIPNI